MLILAIVLLGGCSNSQEVDENDLQKEVLVGRGAMENFSVGDQFQATEPIEVSLLFRELPTAPFQHDWTFVQKLADITQVSFSEVISVIHDDFAQQRNLLIGAGEAPEIMPFIWAGHETPFIAGGSILPVSEYFQYMPNFTHFVEEWGLEDSIENLRQDDGHIYLLPGLQQDPRVRFTVALRKDILDEHGIGLPDTWYEIRDVLRELKAIYPDMYPFNDRWTLDSTLNISASTWGVGAGWGFGSGLHLNRESNEFSYVATMDEFKDFIQFWHSFIAEGLLHPESLTQGDAAAWEAFVNGESFMIGSAGAVGLEEYRRDFDANIADGADHLKGYEIVALPIPQGPTGRIGEQLIDSGMILNSSLKDRDDFIAVLQFIDWLWYSEEGREFAMWGVEGETFQINEDGHRELLSGYQHRGLGLNLNEAYEDMHVDHGFFDAVFSLAGGSSSDLMTSVMNEEAKDIHIRNAETRDLNPITPRIPYTDLELEQISLMQTALGDFTQSNIAQFILGQRSLEEWDQFVEELETMGMSRYVEMANEAWKRR